MPCSQGWRTSKTKDESEKQVVASRTSSPVSHLLTVLLALISTILGASLRYLLITPLKIYILIVSVLEIFSWTNFGPVVKLKNVVSFPDVAEKVGFVDGFAPIGSWENFKLCIISPVSGSVFALPVFLAHAWYEATKRTPFEKFNRRISIGKVLSSYSEVAGMALVVVSIYLFSYPEIATPQLPSEIKWAVILLFGATLGMDNVKYSEMGEKLGMRGLLGKRRAAEKIARDIGLSETDIIKMDFFELAEAIKKSDKVI